MHGKIDDIQVSACGIPDGEGCASPRFVPVTNAQGRVFHHKTVAHLHTARIIPFRKHVHPIGPNPYFVVHLLTFGLPAGGLFRAGKSKAQAYVRMFFLSPQNSKRGHRVKSEGSSTQETAISLCVSFFDRLIDVHCKACINLRLDNPMPGETCGFHESIFKTARKASLGTCTLPNWRIRFLPSFCFSRSFFFRVMSPP